MDSLLILPVSSVALAFGLDWVPLLGGRATRAAHRVARQHRATHLVIAGDATAAVGLARLRRKEVGRSLPLHSAAQNVARLFSSGTVALLLELDAAHHWLVAVHEGAVVARTDRVYASADQARGGLDELRQAFPQLALLGEGPAPQAPGLAAIAAVSDDGSRLLRAGRWHHSVPAWLRWLGLAVVLAVLLPKTWSAIKPLAPAAPPPLNPVQAWLHATELAGGVIAVHGVLGTQAVLDSLYQLPLRLAGWGLGGAGCEPLPGHWQCRARYTRLSAQASNKTLLARAPSAWHIDFASIEHAEPVWRVSSASLPLMRAPITSVRENERHLWSALQSIQPAFSAMQLGRSVPLAIAAPRDAQGQSIARPDELPVYSSRGVRFEGPLRSVSVLLPYTGSISWKKITLSLHDARMVGLTSSRLHLSLEGDLYEIQAPRPSGSANPGTAQALSRTAQRMASGRNIEAQAAF